MFVRGRELIYPRQHIKEKTKTAASHLYANAYKSK